MNEHSIQPLVECFYRLGQGGRALVGRLHDLVGRALRRRQCGLRCGHFTLHTPECRLRRRLCVRARLVLVSRVGTRLLHLSLRLCSCRLRLPLSLHTRDEERMRSSR